MGFGGYHPYPRRMGGGKPLLKVAHEALNASRGSALGSAVLDSTTVVWVENMAYARALTFDGWGVNERLSKQWDPLRMTDMLGRWEKILAILPAPDATSLDRRRAVLAKFRQLLAASALHARLLEILERELGDFFLTIEYIAYANAVIHVPDASYPWGTPIDDVPWSSTTAHMLVLLQRPAGATEADFYAAAAKIAPAIDGVLPAWMTFNWYRAPAQGAPVTVVGGPSAGGFYLDNDHNLDNNVFST